MVLILYKLTKQQTVADPHSALLPKINYVYKPSVKFTFCGVYLLSHEVTEYYPTESGKC